MTFLANAEMFLHVSVLKMLRGLMRFEYNSSQRDVCLCFPAFICYFGSFAPADKITCRWQQVGFDPKGIKKKSTNCKTCFPQNNNISLCAASSE